MLVDEFQDTDPFQGEILQRLAGDAPGDGRLFLVGDFKQSIYRFRGARPRIFEDFRERFPAEGRHALTENFRSVAGLLDFVNALFAGTFPGPENRARPRPEDPSSRRASRRRVPLGVGAPSPTARRRGASPTTAGWSRPAGSPGGCGRGSTKAGPSATGTRASLARPSRETSPSCSAR